MTPYFAAIALLLPAAVLATGGSAAYFCAPASNAERISFGVEVETLGTPSPDGTFRMPSALRFGGVCIDDVVVAASFGVLVVMGRFCAGSTEKVVSAVEALTKIQPRRDPAPNVLATFPLPSHGRDPAELIIHRGEPGEKPPPSTTAKSFSFICARREGSSQ